MPRATWNGVTLAESAHTVVLEGNHYFPTETLNRTYFASSETKSFCPWKGEASYYSIIVANETHTDAAWYYPDPKAEAAQIAGHVAFWKGVEVNP